MQIYNLISKQIHYYNNERIYTSIKNIPARYYEEWARANSRAGAVVTQNYVSLEENKVSEMLEVYTNLILLGMILYQN